MVCTKDILETLWCELQSDLVKNEWLIQQPLHSLASVQISCESEKKAGRYASRMSIGAKNGTIN